MDIAAVNPVSETETACAAGSSNSTVGTVSNVSGKSPEMRSWPWSICVRSTASNSGRSSSSTPTTYLSVVIERSRTVSDTRATRARIGYAVSRE